MLVVVAEDPINQRHADSAEGVEVKIADPFQIVFKNSAVAGKMNPSQGLRISIEKSLQPWRWRARKTSIALHERGHPKTGKKTEPLDIIRQFGVVPVHAYEADLRWTYAGE